MQKLKGDKFSLFTRYLSFLIYEAKNLVGSLIFSYNFIYSEDYKNKSNLYYHFILQNYLNITKKKLHKKYLQSNSWLSSERIHSVFEYSKTLDSMEKQFFQLVSVHMDFYQELQGTAVSYKQLRKTADIIYHLKKKINQNFDYCFAMQKDNSKLISLWINYKLNIEFESDFMLSEKFLKLNQLIKQDRMPQTLDQLKNRRNQINLFSN